MSASGSRGDGRVVSQASRAYAARKAPLEVYEVAHLHEAICEAESALILSPELADERAETLRAHACDLTAELLTTLARLRRRLIGDDGQAPARETHAEWIRAQTASSGVEHRPKPSGRTFPASRYVRSVA